MEYTLYIIQPVLQGNKDGLAGVACWHSGTGHCRDCPSKKRPLTSTWIMDIHFTFVDMYFTFPRKIYYIFYILHLRICTLHLLVKKMSSDQYADIHYYTGEVNFTTPASGTTCSFY